jgi:hypothetical protein
MYVFAYHQPAAALWPAEDVICMCVYLYMYVFMYAYNQPAAALWPAVDMI